MRGLGLSFCVLVVSMSSLFGQTRKYDVYEYIGMFAKIAVSEMERTGIPASITLAQGILESGSGNSRLATKGNNHFGIKCHEWEGESILEDDDALDECFRKYPDPTQSYYDHSEFLVNRKRYSFLFNYKNTDYKKWAKGLKQAGYATNPKYADKLIELVERYSLDQYDLKTASEVPESPLLAELIQGKKAVAASEPIADNRPEPKTIITKSNDFSKPDKIEKKPINQAKLDRSKTSTKQKRSIENFYVNGVLANRVQEGETVADLSNRLEVPQGMLKRYNEWNSNQDIISGYPVFLQPKRKKNRTVREYIVKENDTWQSISQITGVRKVSIFSLNNASETTPLIAGEKISVLRKKRGGDGLSFFDRLFGRSKEEEPSSPQLAEENTVNLPSNEEFDNANIPDYNAPSSANQGEIDFGIPKPEEQNIGTQVPASKGTKADYSWLQPNKEESAGQKLLTSNKNLDIEGVSDLVYIATPKNSDKLGQPDTNNPQNKSGRKAGFFESTSNPVKRPEGKFEETENPVKRPEGKFEETENPVKRPEGKFEEKENPVKRPEGKFEETENPVKRPEGKFEETENPVKKPEGKFIIPDTSYEQNSGYFGTKKNSKNVKEKVVREIVHKVKAGETMYRLSKLYDVEIDDIKKWNDLDSYTINIGQSLLIKKIEYK